MKNILNKILISKIRLFSQCEIIFLVRESNKMENKIKEFIDLKEIIINDINKVRKMLKINDLLYIDTHGKLCCTETLESAINLIKYNDKK